MGCFLAEIGEPLLPVGAELCAHAALDERPAHWRRLRLELGELIGIFGWQKVRDGRQDLRDLHQRALGLAKGGRKRAGGALIAFVAAKETVRRKGDACPGKTGADFRRPPQPGAEPVTFAIFIFCHGAASMPDTGASNGTFCRASPTRTRYFRRWPTALWLAGGRPSAAAQPKCHPVSAQNTCGHRAADG